MNKYWLTIRRTKNRWKTKLHGERGIYLYQACEATSANFFKKLIEKIGGLLNWKSGFGRWKKKCSSWIIYRINAFDGARSLYWALSIDFSVPINLIKAEFVFMFNCITNGNDSTAPHTAKRDQLCSSIVFCRRFIPHTLCPFKSMSLWTFCLQRSIFFKVFYCMGGWAWSCGTLQALNCTLKFGNVKVRYYWKNSEP